MSALRVVGLDLRTDGRYETFIASHPKAQIFHHPGWLSSLEAEYGTTAIVLGCENDDHDLEGVLPLLRTRGIPFNIDAQQTGRRLSSLPRTPLAGLLFTSEDAAQLLLKAAVDHAAVESGTQLQIKSPERLPAAVCVGLHCTSWRPTYVLDVPENREDLRFRDARHRHNIRWAVRKAEENGITVRPAQTESDLLAWYRMYLETMRRKFVPPRSRRLFVAMWRNLVPKGLMRLQVAELNRDGSKELIAGSIFLTFRDTICYAFTGIGDHYLSLHANDLILWRTINDACGTGVRRFDLGEVPGDDPELARFKTKWGATPKDQYRCYWNGPEPTRGHHSKSLEGAMQLASWIWRRLPLRVTQELGDLIYSRL